MEAWSAAMAIPPSAEECSISIVARNGGCKSLSSTPSSSTSGCISADDSCNDIKHMPPGLTSTDLQILQNSTATVHELEQAIERCRQLVLDTEQCSEERKWVVRHLIELRLRLQERHDADRDPKHPLNVSGEVVRVILGHHFKPIFSKPTSSKVHCDHCSRIIWSLIQAWYVCEDCGFVSHHKCVVEILRICAHVQAADEPQYNLDICPEVGLYSQLFKCAECSAQISLACNSTRIGCFGRAVTEPDLMWNEARICDYNGKYYCPKCHWNASLPIPARVVHNWDLEPRLVCQASAQLLRLTFSRPLLPLATLNKCLFGRVHELSLVQKLRDQLILTKRYLANCRVATEQHILNLLSDRIHLMEGCLSTEEPSIQSGGVHLYSMQDIIETGNGTLATYLQEKLQVFMKHIKTECQICYGRGHFCEFCDETNVLFPFDDGVHVCKVCSAVFHRVCWTMRRQTCPRCDRRKHRQETTPIEHICPGKCDSDCDCPLALVFDSFHQTEINSPSKREQKNICFDEDSG